MLNSELHLMRDATKEEIESVNSYIKKISKPINNFNFYDNFERCKSMNKYTECCICGIHIFDIENILLTKNKQDNFSYNAKIIGKTKNALTGIPTKVEMEVFKVKFNSEELSMDMFGNYSILPLDEDTKEKFYMIKLLSEKD